MRVGIGVWIVALTLAGCGSSPSEAQAGFTPQVHLASGAVVTAHSETTPFAGDGFKEATCSPPTTDQAERVAELTFATLDEIPVALSQWVGRVVVCHELQVEGNRRAGLGWGGIVLYLGADHLDTPEDLIERVATKVGYGFFYAGEPSPTDMERWNELAPIPEGAEETWEDLLAENFDRTASDEAMALGYYSEYVQAFQYLDMPTIIGMLLLGDPGLWEGYEKHELFREKVDVVMDILRGAEPRLDKAWFESRSQEPLR